MLSREQVAAIEQAATDLFPHVYKLREGEDGMIDVVSKTANNCDIMDYLIVANETDVRQLCRDWQLMRTALTEFTNLRNESRGVVGYHFDEANWDWLLDTYMPTVAMLNKETET